MLFSIIQRAPSVAVSVRMCLHNFWGMVLEAYIYSFERDIDRCADRLHTEFQISEKYYNEIKKKILSYKCQWRWKLFADIYSHFLPNIQTSYQKQYILEKFLFLVFE